VHLRRRHFGGIDLRRPLLPGREAGRESERQSGKEDWFRHYQPGFCVSVPFDN